MYGRMKMVETFKINDYYEEMMQQFGTLDQGNANKS